MPTWLIEAIAVLAPQAIAAITQMFEAKKGAAAIDSAAQAATAAQLSMFATGQAALQPYLTGGARVTGILDGQPAVKAVAAKPAKKAQPAKNFQVTLGGHTRNVAWNDTATLNKLKGSGWKVTQQGHGPIAATKAVAAVAAKPAVPGEMQKTFMTPISMTQADVEKTPGYQFALNTGLNAGVKSLTQRGFGPGSGAAVKGAEQFATGLASQTYEQQFQNALANKQMEWTALYGQASLGEGAATGSAREATEAGGKIGENLVTGGAAKAGADIATANAVTNFANTLTTQQLLANERASSTTPPATNADTAAVNANFTG